MSSWRWMMSEMLVIHLRTPLDENGGRTYLFPVQSYAAAGLVHIRALLDVHVSTFRFRAICGWMWAKLRFSSVIFGPHEARNARKLFVCWKLFLSLTKIFAKYNSKRKNSNKMCVVFNEWYTSTMGSLCLSKTYGSFMSF